MTPWFRRESEALLLFVRVTPNAKKDAIEAPAERDDGSWRLPVRVRAVPEEGAANRAVIALLSKAAGVPKSDIAVDSGTTARLKTIRIAVSGGDQDTIIERLEKPSGKT
ncbi:MAG: DUF167 domain-containing protein [Hyphomicrobiaceae bacterium]|nr:DUF167 domain-containing protein [Hyphomicrobiaceae bacterium]